MSNVNSSNVVSVWEKWTKVDAKKIFADKVPNRNIRTDKVNEYCQLMNTGKWHKARLVSPIGIDTHGRLVAGQHRFAAFIKSNLEEIYFPVVREVSPDEAKYADMNIPTTLRDRVNMFHKTPETDNMGDTQIQAAVKVLLNNPVDPDKNRRGNSKDPETISSYIYSHFTEINELDILLTKKSYVKKYGSVIAGLLFAYPLMNKNKWKECVLQLSNIDQFNLGANHPMVILRSVLNGFPKSYTNEDRKDVFIKTLVCLRAIQLDQEFVDAGAVCSLPDVVYSKTWK